MEVKGLMSLRDCQKNRAVTLSYVQFRREESWILAKGFLLSNNYKTEGIVRYVLIGDAGDKAEKSIVKSQGGSPVYKRVNFIFRADGFIGDIEVIE